MSATPPDTRALTGVDDLLSAGFGRVEDAPAMRQVAATFRIRMTPAMRDAAQPGAPADPVAAQFVPDQRELTIRPEELADPIGDAAHSPVPGLTHRYPDRVILHVTQSCEVYCRFCFRREGVGQTGALPAADLDAALDYIAATPAIHEVILTGGDPLTLSARRIGAVLDRLDAIAHVDLVRFHTRIPVVAPQRIDAAMIAAMTGRRLVPWLVLHSNHAAELTAPACAALGRLSGAGVPLLSQTVLLRGVNDDADTLEALLRALLRNRVKPYYLHHCDLAKGTGHFRTTIGEGQAIMAALRGRISGMAMPGYVLDLPGGFGKVPLTGPDVQPAGAGRWRIRDRQGVWHDYADPPR